MSEERSRLAARAAAAAADKKQTRANARERRRGVKASNYNSRPGGLQVRLVFSPVLKVGGYRRGELIQLAIVAIGAPVKFARLQVGQAGGIGAQRGAVDRPEHQAL